MFVAYLVPRHETYLVVEDGLGFLAIAETEEAALAKLQKQYLATYDEGDDEWEAIEARDSEAEYALFVAKD